LAGEAAANNIDGADIELAKFADIFEDGDVGPVSSQHRSAERLDLAEGNGPHPGSFKSKRESSDAAE
jgi:hypothetical protein